MDDYRFSPALDIADLAARFARDRRVRIEGVLANDAAARLHAHLAAREDWRQIVNSGPKIFELDRTTRAAMGADRLAALDRAVHAGARSGFQHRYEAIRVPDAVAEREPLDDPLARFVHWMSGAALPVLRAITGITAIDFADGQATAYRAGDFLTAHDDAVAGKHRHAAYVMGLTSGWRAEYGGLLLFHDGAELSGRVPGFNCLDLFAVPQPHSVSMVTPAAPAPRYAVTGWLRGLNG